MTGNDGRLQGDFATEGAYVVDPFGYWANFRSRFPGLGGNDEPVDPTYAFHSAYVPLSRGTVRVRIILRDLRVADGSMLVRIFSQDPEKDMLVKQVTSRWTRLRDMIATGLPAEIDFEAQDGLNYAVIGNLSGDVDVSVSQIVISLETLPEGSLVHRNRSARPDVAKTTAAGTFRFIVFQPPSLRHPLSQPFTEAQLAELAAKRWLAAGFASGRPANAKRDWMDCYVLEALTRYGFLVRGAHGMGFDLDGSRIAAVAARIGCDILLLDPSGGATDDVPIGEDIGSISGRIAGPGEIPDNVAGFDFLWSAMATVAIADVTDAMLFIEDSLRCLNPGGLAIHIVDAVPNGEGGPVPHKFRRIDIERFVLNVIGNGNEAASLNFESFGDAFGSDAEAIPSQPFGIIIRRSTSA